MPLPKRILWIADNQLSVSLHASRCLETTKNLRELGWDVHLVTPDASKQGKGKLRGIELRFFTGGNIFFFKQLLFHWKVFRWYSQSIEGGGLILFHETSGIWCRLFQLYRRLAGHHNDHFVIDTRSLPMEPEENMGLRIRLRKSYFKFVNNHANRWFDGHTTITLAMAESLKIPKNKLWAIWQSGVDLDKFRGIPALRKFPVDDTPIRLIYIGCMHVERNLLAFSQAVVKANNAGTNFRLVFVGYGNQFEEIKTYAEGYANIIEVHHSVPQEEIPKWLAGAHIGVIPFPDEEKFQVSSPIKLFEYMASGLPILATKIRCHTDVLINGGNVFWVDGSGVDDFYTVLMNICEERDKLVEMGKLSLKLVEAYTWKASSQRLSDGLITYLYQGGR